MTTWVFSLRRSEADRLARLVDVVGVEVAESGEIVWVRGPGGPDAVTSILNVVPSARFFELLAPDRLRARGRLVPTARLPPASFRPLRSFLRLELPRVALPGDTEERVELRLVPGTGPRGGEELLLAATDAFREFLAEAPSYRLTPLRFTFRPSASRAALESLNETPPGAEEAVLVRGEPLPGIPGERFVLREAIAVPAGLVWTPAVSVSTLRNWLGLPPSTLALWTSNGTIAEIAEASFVPASRRVRHVL